MYEDTALCDFTTVDVSYQSLPQKCLLRKKPYDGASDVFWNDRRAEKTKNHGDQCLPFLVSLFGTIDPSAIDWLLRVFKTVDPRSSPCDENTSATDSVDNADIECENRSNDVSASTSTHNEPSIAVDDKMSSLVRKKLRRIVQDVAYVPQIKFWRQNYRMYRTAAFNSRNENPRMFHQNTNINDNSQGTCPGFCGLTL